MRKLFGLLMIIFSTSCFAGGACPKADPITSSTFCSTFETAAKCQCSASLGSAYCNKPEHDMEWLYNYTLSTFHGSLDEACAYSEHHGYSKKQECIDDWNCYRNGGYDSAGNACSGTGLKC